MERVKKRKRKIKPKTSILPVRIETFKLEQLQLRYPNKVSPKVVELIDEYLLS